MWMRLIFGVLLTLVGAVWFAQGINVLGGSFMSGDATWAFIGLPMVVIGVLLLRSIGRSQRGDVTE